MLGSELVDGPGERIVANMWAFVSFSGLNDLEFFLTANNSRLKTTIGTQSHRV